MRYCGRVNPLWEDSKIRLSRASTRMAFLVLSVACTSSEPNS